MEIQQTKDRITIYGELNDVYRRIYLDGRKPSPKVLDDPTFAGYSTGHWEGDTLVVDTVAIREDALFDTFSPHSDQFTVRERLRFASPGVLENQITSTDPKALVEPFQSVRTYRKAVPPNDEWRVLVCGRVASRSRGRTRNLDATRRAKVMWRWPSATAASHDGLLASSFRYLISARG
jgi:hypothetical protein